MLEKMLTPDLREELEYRATCILEGDVDSTFSLDRDSDMELVMGELEDFIRTEGNGRPRTWLYQIRKWMIEHGVYVQTTIEEMDKTYISRGKKYDFKMGGRFYRFGKHIEEGK